MIGAGDGVVFDWEPTLTSAAELITAPRGTDARLDERRRPTRDQRRAEYFERMDAKAAARAADAAERAGGFWDDDGGTGDTAPTTGTGANGRGPQLGGLLPDSSPAASSPVSNTTR